MSIPYIKVNILRVNETTGRSWVRWTYPDVFNYNHTYVYIHKHMCIYIYSR